MGRSSIAGRLFPCRIILLPLHVWIPLLDMYLRICVFVYVYARICRADIGSIGLRLAMQNYTYAWQCYIWPFCICVFAYLCSCIYWDYWTKAGHAECLPPPPPLVLSDPPASIFLCIFSTFCTFCQTQINILTFTNTNTHVCDYKSSTCTIPSAGLHFSLHFPLFALFANIV